MSLFENILVCPAFLLTCLDINWTLICEFRIDRFAFQDFFLVTKMNWPVSQNLHQSQKKQLLMMIRKMMIGMMIGMMMIGMMIGLMKTMNFNVSKGTFHLTEILQESASGVF